MITGVDYILYTDKSQDALIEKIKETIPFWENPLSYRIKLQKELRLNSFLLEFQYVQQLIYMIVKE